MIQLRFDAHGNQQVRWPRSDAEVIRLGRAFLAAEQRLAAAARFPRLDRVQQRQIAAEAALNAAQGGEADRSSASVAVAATFAQARATVRKVIAGLTYRHLDELPVLEQWGIAVVQTRPGPKTRSPKDKAGVLELLTRYVAREQSLAEAERLPQPPLAEVAAVRDALATALDSRQAARTQREQGVGQRSSEVQALLDLLQLAATYHVLVDYDGVVDARLQGLGFQVVAAPAAPRPAAPPPAGG